MRQRVLFALLGVLAFLTAFYLVGIAYAFFWQFWWYDLIAHFLGGVCAGLGAVWLLSLRGAERSTLLAFIFVLLIGTLWEAYEAYYKLSLFPFDLFDTVHDLLFDCIGGCVGIYAAHVLLGR
jgi:hypothetical protein